MSAARVSVRYAKAFVGALSKQPKAEQEIAAFCAFCRLVREQSELRSVFANVTLRPDKKLKVLRALATKVGLPTTTMRFLEVLAKHDRLAILDSVEAAVRKKMDEQAGIQNVVLKTATSLRRPSRSLFSAISSSSSRKKR